ncbi:MAG: hypothetical protein ABI445_24230 [Polyangia bacterium]
MPGAKERVSFLLLEPDIIASYERICDEEMQPGLGISRSFVARKLFVEALEAREKLRPRPRKKKAKRS